MRLYHGTSSRHLDAILKDGIRPRGRRQGNWKHTVTSNHKAVYLTDAYSIYFAQCALEGKEDLAIIEIDATLLDPSLLAPDEDFLEQASRADPNIIVFGLSTTKRNSWFRKRIHKHYAHLWQKSLERLGVCAYLGTIEPVCMTRVAILPFGHRVRVLSDPVVCLQGYAVMGKYYRNLTRNLFGDTDYEPNIMWSRPAARDGITVKVLK